MFPIVKRSDHISPHTFEPSGSHWCNEFTFKSFRIYVGPRKSTLQSGVGSTIPRRYPWAVEGASCTPDTGGNDAAIGGAAAICGPYRLRSLQSLALSL